MKQKLIMMALMTILLATIATATVEQFDDDLVALWRLNGDYENQTGDLPLAPRGTTGQFLTANGISSEYWNSTLLGNSVLTVDEDTLGLDATEWTIAFWYQMDESVTNQGLINHYISGGDDGFMIRQQVPTSSQEIWTDTGSYTAAPAYNSEITGSGDWALAVLVKDATTIDFYQNATVVTTPGFGTIGVAKNLSFMCGFTGGGCDVGGVATGMNGRIDEIGIWHSAWTAANVTAYWNSGAGCFFGDSSCGWAASTTVEFNNLQNNASTVSTTGFNVSFGVNVTSTFADLDTCWFTHNDSGSFVNLSVLDCSGDVSYEFNTSFLIASNPGAYVCGFYGGNTSDSVEADSSDTCFTVQDITFPTWRDLRNNFTSEVVEELVNWSVALEDDGVLSHYVFSYNGTGSWVNDSEIAVSGTFANASAIKNLPNTVLYNVCGFFYLNDTFNNENTTDMSCATTPDLLVLNVTVQSAITNESLFSFNVTAYELSNTSNVIGAQTSNGFAALSLRGGNYSITAAPDGYTNVTGYKNLTGSDNLTLFTVNKSTIFVRNILDEITRAALVNWTVEVIGDTFANNYSSSSNLSITGVPVGNYTLRYSRALYQQRLYFLELIDDGSADIILYLLETANSSSVAVNVKDQGFNDVEDVIVKALRYYIGLNTYEVVEMGKTDFEGNTELHLQQDSEFYKFIVQFESQTKLTTEGSIITSTIVTNGLNFQINTVENVFDTVDDLIGVDASLFYNNNTGTFSFTYNDASGTLQQGCLEVRQPNLYGLGTISMQCSESNSASILYTIANLSKDGTYIATATLQSEDDVLSNTTTILVDSVTVTISSSVGAFALNGVLLAVVFVGIIGFISISNPTTTVMLFVVGLGLASLIGIAVTPWGGIAALFVMTAAVAWKAGILQR